MRIIRTSWRPAAVGLAVTISSLAALSTTVSAAAAVAPVPSPPTTPAAAGQPVVDATTQPVVDDTRTLTLEIPATWTDISTTPGTGVDGSQFPQIAASPNLTSFSNSFDTPGVMYAAQTLNPDTAAALKATWDFSGQCTDGGTQPYQDLYFAGTMQTWTACGGGQGRVVTVFANPIDQRFSVAMIVGLATPADDEALSLLLASFFVTKPQAMATGQTGAATTPTTLPVVTPQGPAAVTPTTLPGVVTPTTGVPATPGDAVILEDDTRTIGVAVPSSWTQVNTSPATGPNGQVPAISAAPDLNAFQSGAGVGMFMVAAAPTTDLAAGIASMAPQQCQPGAATPYQDEVFNGMMQTFENCNGLTVTVLAANAASNPAATVQIVVATLPGDDTPLRTVATSFDFVAAAATAPAS